MRVNISVNLPDNATEADAFKAVRRAFEGSPTVLEPDTSRKVKGLRVTTKGPNLSEARIWARANGHVVGKRGRLSQEILDAFEAANA
jgi:hypothetical protein